MVASQGTSGRLLVMRSSKHQWDGGHDSLNTGLTGS